MPTYANRDGNSGVVSYEIGDGWIELTFNDGSTYRYTIQSAGAGNFENWYAIAANFDRKFGDFRIGVAGSYLSMEGGPPLTGVVVKDAEGYGAGLLLETGPFKIAFGYSKVDDWETAPGIESRDGESFDIGARYTMGAHKFGVVYFHGEIKGTLAVTGDDESDTFGVSHAMSLGPGVTWKNDIQYTDWDQEGVNTAALDLDNDGWGVATHIALNF